MFRKALVQNLGHRNINWSGMSEKLSDPKARVALNSLRKLYNETVQEHQIYSKDPAPIDFEAYKSKIKFPGIVEALQTDYQNLKIANLEIAGIEGETEEHQKIMEQAKKQVAFSQARIDELQETITLMEASKTTRDTTIDELDILYPEATQEIDQEIANYEWDKDLK